MRASWRWSTGWPDGRAGLRWPLTIRHWRVRRSSACGPRAPRASWSCCLDCRRRRADAADELSVPVRVYVPYGHATLPYRIPEARRDVRVLGWFSQDVLWGRRKGWRRRSHRPGSYSLPLGLATDAASATASERLPPFRTGLAPATRTGGECRWACSCSRSCWRSTWSWGPPRSSRERSSWLPSCVPSSGVPGGRRWSPRLRCASRRPARCGRPTWVSITWFAWRR